MFKTKLPPINKAHKAANNAFSMDKFQAIRFSQSETLKLSSDKRSYRELDHNFIEDVTSIAKTNDNLISIITRDTVELTDIQCEEIHYRGNLHREANIINSNTKLSFDATDDSYKCQCGCKRARGKKIDLCSSIKEFDCLGAGVALFLLFQKGIAINLLLAAAIFSIFTTYSNLSQGNQPSLSFHCSDSKCSFITNSSAQNNNQSPLANVEYILGIVFCIIWIFSLRFLKEYGKQIESHLDGNLESSSDFAIKIDNLPFGEYNEDQIIEYFQNLLERERAAISQQNHKQISENLGMKSIQIIYNMQFSRTLIAKIRADCLIITSLIEEKDNHYFIAQSETQKYKATKQGIIQTYQILSDLRKKFFTDGSFRKKIATASCIIEFYEEKDKNVILDKYGKQKIGLLKKLQAIILNFFCPSSNSILFHGKVLQIERAPEPSDIIWLNCEKKKSILRLVLIYLITFIIIVISFGLLLGLQYIHFYFAQQDKENGNGESGTISQVISLGTTIALQIVNKILWIVLYFLLDIQYNDTLTNKIVSLMNKSLFATCINILILPIVVYAYMQNNLYGPDGLVGFVFNYHITVITVGLALKMFNPVHMLIGLALNIRPIKYKILNFVRAQFDEKQEQAFMQKIYRLYEAQYMDIAESYIFTITNVFHAIFFCHLSPPLLFFALAEIFIYLWINRIKLLRFFKIPELIEILVFDNAITQACLVPIIYGCGSHFIGYFQNGQNEIYGMRAILELLAIGVGVFSFFNPGNILNFVVRPIMNIFYPEANKVGVDSVKESDHEVTNSELIKNEPKRNMVRNSDILNPQSAKLTRLQNYYDNSNSLKLLGFQQTLKDNTSFQEFGNELKNFCENFFQDNNRIKSNENECQLKQQSELSENEKQSRASQ